MIAFQGELAHKRGEEPVIRALTRACAVLDMAQTRARFAESPFLFFLPWGVAAGKVGAGRGLSSSQSIHQLVSAYCVGGIMGVCKEARCNPSLQGATVDWVPVPVRWVSMWLCEGHVHKVMGSLGQGGYF